MKIFALFCIAIGIGNELLGSDLLREEPFKTRAQITWGVTNVLPASMMLYKQVLPSPPESMISNAMAFGNFSLLNRVQSPDKGILVFQDKPAKMGMTRRLRLCPATGWLEYIDCRAQSFPVKGVPSFEEANRLAIELFQRLGGDTNQINPKPRSPAEGTATTFDRKTGRDIETVICSQMITLRRQVRGIDIGSSFIISFANEAKPDDINMDWPKLEPYKECQIAKPDQIISFLKSGRAIIPKNNVDAPEDAPLTITKVQPYYPTLEDQAAIPGFVYPWGRLELTAHLGKTNQSVLHINCPLIDKAHLIDGFPEKH